jgi:ABC-2 type transport system permease protein
MTGLGALIRLILRRDRVILPLWILALVSFPINYYLGNAAALPTDAERVAYAQGAANSAAEVALIGPVYGSSLGAISAWRVGFILVFVAVASLLTVIRHTRAEEEAGRRELIGATVVGRQAPLAAALIVTLAANLVMGLLIAAGVAGQGAGLTGSLAIGLGMAGVGWAFAGIGAVAAQLTEGARTARGTALAALAAFFLLRAIGDTSGPAWLSWLSPLGWAHRVRPFAGERWWVLILPVVAMVAFAALAFALSGRRDVAAGFLPTRPGPAGASATLRSPLALAWRLHRSVFLSWFVAMAVFGVVFGSVADSIVDQIGNSPAVVDVMRRLGGVDGLVDAYFVTVMAILGLAASAYAISATLRLRTEEETLRAEPVLATSVSRVGWTWSHLAISLGGPAVLLVTAGLATGLVHGASTGDMGHQVSRIVIAALVQLPAVWLLAGVAVALFGLIPRFAALAWVGLALCVLLGQVGEVLRLNQWAMDLSPFTHLPKAPAADVVATPLLWLTAIAVALVATGLTGFRRRDVG